ncbi:MAG TPA: hypothetical protein VJO13_17960 [Ktedonobacterales bacterium]|nr:hypothetical protein [Ktedonobacterales bacterium]
MIPYGLYSIRCHPARVWRCPFQREQPPSKLAIAHFDDAVVERSFA